MMLCYVSALTVVGNGSLQCNDNYSVGAVVFCDMLI